jgi:hypothetical protein
LDAKLQNKELARLRLNSNILGISWESTQLASGKPTVMVGLVSYGSSDEEDNSQDRVPEGPLDVSHIPLTQYVGTN